MQRNVQAHSWASIEPALMRNLKPVDPDDEFNFHCTRCADCCKNIDEAVALEPIDVFRISRHLRGSGDPDLNIGDILTKYAVPVPLTDFGYMMYFVNTNGPDASCAFLKSGKCGIHDAKPRACRMYPLTADPAEGGDGFNYYLITERLHHLTGPAIRVGDWMDERMDSEERQYTAAEYGMALKIGRLMRQSMDSGVKLKTLLAWFMHFKYFNYDTSQPFLGQYLSNMEALVYVLNTRKEAA